MTVKSQQVTNSAGTKAAPAKLLVIARVRGFAGNHTIMRTKNSSEKSEGQDDELVRRLPQGQKKERSLQRKCECGTDTEAGDCKECRKKRAAGTLQRAIIPSEHRLDHGLCHVEVGAQSKFTVNATGDRHEQEADRMASLVMGAPESCGGHHGYGTAEPITAPRVVDEVLSSPGSALDAPARMFMESRFGHDFSRVRVHTDAKAAQSARQVAAVAYTVGHDVVFDSGRYAPNTLAGRRLLAHELSHTIQQGAALQRLAQPGQDQLVTSAMHSIRPAIQRALKFEMQTTNEVTANNDKKGTRRRLPRKFNDPHHLHKGKAGVELQVESGSVIEFETAGWMRRWSKLAERIQEAVDIVTEINAKNGEGFPYSEERSLRSSGKLKKDEKLVVNITDPLFLAKIQSSEGITLPQYESFLKEHIDPTEVVEVTDSAQNILDGAMTANPDIDPTTNTDNLRGLLQVIVKYIRDGQTDIEETDVTFAKERIFLMHRTWFSSMFRDLLTKDEQTLFRQIVKSDAIPTELGVGATDEFFKAGYWGNYEGMKALFRGGKIVALTKDEQNIFDCATKETTDTSTTLKTTVKPPGIDAGKCRDRVPETKITIGSWLKSIVKKGHGPDQLSHPPHGSAAMGGEGAVVKKVKGRSKSKGKHKDRSEHQGLALFETRATIARGGNQDIPASKWVSFAEDVFREGAVCRPRLGKTELKYDGANPPFDPAGCP